MRSKKRVEVWVTDQEYEQIRELANRRGLAMSALGRMLFLEAGDVRVPLKKDRTRTKKNREEKNGADRESV